MLQCPCFKWDLEELKSEMLTEAWLPVGREPGTRDVEPQSGLGGLIFGPFDVEQYWQYELVVAELVVGLMVALELD
ncbi:hypothetical protein Tco_1342161 [Tanacetum coccineum]